MDIKFERCSFNGPGGPQDFLVGGEGAPLVCLHRSSGVRVNPSTLAIARQREVYLPIVPGFDGTRDIAGIATVSSVADRIAWLLERLFDAPVDLTGHSLGAWIACWLAVAHGSQVRRLVLQAPAGFNPRFGDALKQDPTTALQRAFAHPERRPPETKSDELIAANRARSARYQGGVGYDAALVERLGEISSPTLIVYGRKDGVVPPETPEILSKSIPVSDILYVEDAAHNLEIDQPDLYADAVKSFLSAA